MNTVINKKQKISNKLNLLEGISKLLKVKMSLLMLLFTAIGLTSITAQASESFYIEKSNDLFNFKACNSKGLNEAQLEAVCRDIATLDSTEMDLFYEELSAHVDRKIRNGRWLKGGLVVGGIIGGGLLLMTPPGQAAFGLIAAGGTEVILATTASSSMATFEAAAVGGILLTLGSVPIISGGVSYYIGDKITDKQLENLDVRNGSELVNGMSEILTESKFLIISQGKLINKILKKIN